MGSGSDGRRGSGGVVAARMAAADSKAATAALTQAVTRRACIGAPSGGVPVGVWQRGRGGVPQNLAPPVVTDLWRFGEIHGPNLALCDSHERGIRSAALSKRLTNGRSRRMSRETTCPLTISEFLSGARPLVGTVGACGLMLLACSWFVL